MKSHKEPLFVNTLIEITLCVHFLFFWSVYENAARHKASILLCLCTFKTLKVEDGEETLFSLYGSLNTTLIKQLF